MQEYYKEIISYIKAKKPSKDALSRHKVKLCKKHRLKEIPTDIHIMLSADAKDLVSIRRYLLAKPTRSISGVAVVAIMTEPKECPHGKCAMCPGGINSDFGNVPQSYTGAEPATRRAMRNDYDPYLQVMNRLEQYIASGHLPDKVELIIMGGTFPSYSKSYQENFVKYAIKAMNDFSRKFFSSSAIDIVEFRRFFELPGDIEDESRAAVIKQKLLQLKRRGKTALDSLQKENETAVIRCIGITQETRPDYGNKEHGNEMLRLGTTRVELGIQSVYDKALKVIDRGHTVSDSKRSIQELRDLGFKLNFHMMPGLPGISKEGDIEGLKELFENEGYMPDMIKLYPCMVMKGTKLYSMWKRGKYIPIDTEQAAEIISEFKRIVPHWCRIMRVQRDIPTANIEAGVNRTNLRQYVKKYMDSHGIVCNCIRCREIGRSNKPRGKVSIYVEHYSASGGNEFFISAETKDSIIGFARLRFPGAQLRKEITPKTAIIRELHVYGAAVSIGKKGKIKGQHRGIGRALMEKAEDIAKTYYKDRMLVISGIGVREYYRKLGYRRIGPYMGKRL